MDTRKIWVFDTSAKKADVSRAVSTAMDKWDMRGSWNYRPKAVEGELEFFVYEFEQSMIGTLGKTGQMSHGAALGFTIEPSQGGTMLTMGIDTARGYGFLGKQIGGDAVMNAKMRAVRKEMKALDPGVSIEGHRG